MRSLGGVVAALVMLVAFPVSVLAQNPDIGGDPIHTEEDYFTEGLWGLTVYSYVYDSTSSSLPDMGISLMSDEMLFVYLLDGDDQTSDSVEYFSVYNPLELAIDTVGYNDTIIPTGYSSGDYQDPINYEYSGFSLTTSYSFTGGYMNTIEPDEWSLVFYVAESGTWALSTGTVAGGGADEELVPSPSPEPTTLCVFGLGALALLRKRRA